MTPLWGTKTPSAPVGDAPVGDDKAAQVTSFQVFTRPETRDKAIAWREAQAGANSEVFTKHEARDTKNGFFQARNTAFPWLVWCSLVLKPFSLFFGRKPVYVESDDAVVVNEKPVRARRGQVGWGRKGRPVAAFLRVVARHGRPPSPALATRPFLFTRRQIFLLERTRPPTMVFTKHETRDTNHSFPTHDFPPFPTISRHFPAPPPPPPPIKCPRAVRLSWSAARDCRPRPVAAFLRVVARHGAAMARHGRHIAPRRRACPVSRSRSSSRRAPLAGLLPVPRTPNEPMLREGNVLIAQTGNFLDCVDNTSTTFPKYSDCGPIEAPTPARLMRPSTRFPQSRDSGPCKPCSTSWTPESRLGGAE